MKKVTRHVLAVVVSVTSIVVALTWAYTPSAGASTTNTATEVGVTPTTIRIAVVADVNNTVVPGLFAGDVRGVQAWAKQINAHGGLAGRKVVVDFIDSQLSSTQSRAAVLQACQNDFALVGTAVVFLTDANDLTSCQDKLGQATGLPNLSNVATSYSIECAPVTFSISGNPIKCATQNQAKPSFIEPLDAIPYLVKKFGKMNALFLVSGDTPGTTAAEIPGDAALSQGGLKVVAQYPLVSSSPQSTFTPIVSRFGTEGIKFVQSGMQFNGLVSAEKEAALQGTKSDVKVWLCSEECFNPQFLSQGGTTINGTYVYLPTLPYSEANSNKDLEYLVKTVGANKMDTWAVSGYVAGTLFGDAVQNIVASKGNNGLTREALLNSLKSIHSFNAGGLWATTDVGNQLPSDCFVLMQVKNQTFQRVYPAKAGSFSCSRNVPITINPTSSS